MLHLGVAGFVEKERQAYAMRHLLRIGPAGAPLSTPAPRSTLEGVRHCRSLGLDAMEVEFVQGVHMKEDLAATVGEEARRVDVSLSVHAPYFINLCSDEEGKLANSRRHILQSVRMAQLLHASPVVFHPGFYQGRSKGECAKRAKEHLKLILDEMKQMGWNDVVLGAELTGKKSAYGDLDEIIDLSNHFGLSHLQPVVDFGHYHARMGRICDKKDYEKILDKIEKELGSGYRQEFHCHYSEIEYTEAGEGKHMPIGSLKAGQIPPATGGGSGGPPYQPLLSVLSERGYSGTIICESPKLEEDALIMKKAYDKMGKK